MKVKIFMNNFSTINEPKQQSHRRDGGWNKIYKAFIIPTSSDIQREVESKASVYKNCLKWGTV